MVRFRPTWLALLVTVVVSTSACGEDAAVDVTPDAVATSDGDEPVPADWQQLDFPGGALSVPADWAVTDPMGGDDLTAFGPDVDDNLPFALRIRTTDRDAVPFETLPGLFFVTLAFQLPSAEALSEEPTEVRGAEEAIILTVRYDEPVDGDTVIVEERALMAWFGGDRQLQLRVAVPVDLLDDGGGTMDEVLDSIVLDD